MLLSRIAADFDAPVDPAVTAAAAMLAAESGAVAVLFYGSVLRTGHLGDVLDFYCLTPGATSVAGRILWPDVGWREIAVGDRTLRTKVATMPLATFARAAAGRTLDTTIWTRFAQPSALVWTADDAARQTTTRAVADAVATAARHAAVLGPASGTPGNYWRALFGETYRSEFRVEAAGRSDSIVDYGAPRYDALLPLAWDAGGIAYVREGDRLTPRIDPATRTTLLRGWRRRCRAGKPLNVARLVKAAFTFDGATRYALYKIERHTGVAIPATPWREAHPILAAPGVLWRLWRARRHATGA